MAKKRRFKKLLNKVSQYAYDVAKTNQYAFRPNKKKEVEAKRDFEASRRQQEEELSGRQEKQDEASAAINELFKNYPKLADNQPFINQLEKGLQESGKTLSDIYNRTEKTGGTYLDQLSQSVASSRADLSRSEQAAQGGIDRSLDIYRNLAKSRTLPGQSVIEDRLGETTSNALSAIKRSGGGRGLSAIADIYKQEMEGRRNLGVNAAQQQLVNQQNLAGAEASAGTTMADIIARNAVTSANMSSNLYGAQSDYLNKLAVAQSNVAQNQANTAQTMYGVNTQNQMNQYLYNELNPAQAQLGWEQTKYQMLDPFAYQMQKLGEDSGFAYASMQQAIQQRNQNKQMLGNVLLEGGKFLATGGLSSITGGLGGGNSVMPSNNQMIAPPSYNYLGAQNYLNGTAYNPVDRYYK